VMGVPYRNRSAAIQFGDVICRALEGGTPFDTLVTMTTSDGYYSTYQARALIGAAPGLKNLVMPTGAARTRLKSFSQVFIG
jgi:hypothetical protein